MTCPCSKAHHTHGGSRADIIMSEVTQSKSTAPRNKATLVSQLPLQELRPKPPTTASMEKSPWDSAGPGSNTG